MKLERLTLNGMTRFTSPVTVRFDQLPAGALVAIVGENGSGKTTILDSTLAALYREMPSRGDKPLIEYANGKNAYIEQVFTVGPIRYKARVSMDALTGRADAVLHRELDGGWVALNDGKVSTFKTAVADRFLPLPVVLASAFAAQNKAGSFLTMDRAGRKDLFTALLGLAHYEQMAESCRASALKLDRRRAELVALVARLDGDVTLEAETRLVELVATATAELAEATRIVDDLVALKPGLSSVADAAVKAQVRASEAVADRRHLLTKRDELTAAIEKADEAIRQQSAALIRTLERLEDQQAEDQRKKRSAIAQVPTDALLDGQFQQRLAQIAQKERADLDAVNVKIRNNQTELLDKREAIVAAATRVAELDHTIAGLRLRVDEGRENQRREEKTLRTLEDAFSRKAGAQARLDAAKVSAGLIAEVPCGGAAPYDACKLLGAASAAKANIPALEEGVRDYLAAEAAVADQRAVLVTVTDGVRDVEGQITTCATERLSHLPLANREPALAVAVVRVAELEQQLQAIQNEAAIVVQSQTELAEATKADAHAHRARMETELAEIDFRAGEDVKREKWAAGARAEEVTRQQELDRTRLALTVASIEATAEAEQEYRMAADKAVLALQDLNRCNDTIARQSSLQAKAEGDQQNATRLLAEFRAKAAEKVAYQTELAPLEQNQVEFEILAKCFGREGLPVLEIDAAGPAISDLTNDLLRSCFESSRFTVELVTQQAKADGKGFKEVFDLRIFDAERGGEPRDLTDLSGGEQIIVDEALKSAIALFMNQQNETPIQTAWRDETTGALDPENAVRYVKMLRRLQERGGFHQVIYITHNPEAAAMADVQLVVADGAVTVRQAPFEEAA